MPRAGDAHLRHVELRAVVGGQLHAFQAQAGDFAQVVQVAADGSRQRGQVGAHVGHGKGDAHAGALVLARHAARLARQPGVGQAGRVGGVQQVDGFDAGARAGAQFIGFALHAGEGAAGLLARHHFGDPRGVHRGFDQIGRAKGLGIHKLGNSKGAAGGKVGSARGSRRQQG
ncbi:hypothetical protein D3C77_580930 [compost metagenome]